jgi:hypothetical protein
LLDHEPAHLESLGMKRRLPVGAMLSKPVKGAMPIYTVDDSRTPPRYHMQIQSYVSSLPEPSPRAQVEDYLDGMRRKGAAPTVISNAPIAVDNLDGQLLWTSTDLGEGIVAVQGWLVIQIGEFDFLVASALCAGPQFPEARPALEACFASISLEDRRQVASDRSERLRRGNAVLGALTPAALRELCTAEPRMYRVYAPDESGREQEIGYYQVTVLAANMSDASGEAQIPHRDDGTGLLVLVQGRTIVNRDTGEFADTESRFWSAFDRSSEAWSSRVTQRGGKNAPRSFAQTGLRAPAGLGNPRQKLLVINADAQSRTREEREWVVPTGIYLSQAETLVLGELLPRDGSSNGDFAYYAFDPRSMQMPQRVETWTPAADGQWMLVTQPGLDEPAEVTLHDSRGRRIRRSEPDGVVTEHCSASEVDRLWKSQGLPSR